MTDATTIDNVIPRADIVKRAARIGAEIRNIKLSGDLSERRSRAINKVLLEHKVIFFRDQDHLDDAEQERFARRLGKLVPHPTVGAIKGTASILELDSGRGGGRADQWHTDVTFVDAYPKISVLRGVVIPEFGGDTIWSNTAAAYLDLPAPLRELADELWAVHSNAYDYAVKTRASEADGSNSRRSSRRRSTRPSIPWFASIPKPASGRWCSAISSQRFVGLPKYDSQKLFDLFQSHITAPENTVRWNWRQGDVVIWDNRATQHYAVNDYGDQHRIVRRATIDGDVPVSIDGRSSVTRIKAAKPQAQGRLISAHIGMKTMKIAIICDCVVWLPACGQEAGNWVSAGRRADSLVGSAAAEPQLEKTEIRYQGWAGQVTFVELAEDLGYLAPLKLKWVGNTISGPQDIQTVVTGDIDIGGAFYGAIIKLIAAKAPIKAVVGYYGSDANTYYGYYVKEDSPIKTARDLIGKKVAVNTLGAHLEFVLREYLARNGVSAGRSQAGDAGRDPAGHGRAGACARDRSR